MKIRMLQTRGGTEDGFSVRQYQTGQEYEVTHSLGCYFTNLGFAENIDEYDFTTPTREGTMGLIDRMEKERLKERIESGNIKGLRPQILEAYQRAFGSLPEAANV